MLERAGLEVVDLGDRVPSEESLWHLVSEVEAMLVTMISLGDKTLERAKKLRVISKFGVGVENIDVDAASARGIPVCNTAGANAESVADHTWALILSLVRRLPYLERVIKEGNGWNPWPAASGVELAGKSLGLVGLGNIGRSVATRAQGFGVHVRAYDVVTDQDSASLLDVQLVGLDDLLRDSDIVSLHVPLTSTTHHLIGKRELNLMRADSYLVNTSRGSVVDEAALVDALREGRLKGAAVDVFEVEPAVDNQLFELPNVVVTPHVAGISDEAGARVRLMAAQNIVRVLGGEKPLSVVNGEVLSKTRVGAANGMD